MIRGITEINFPSYATLHQATVSLEEMGDRVITTQVKIDGDIVPDFTSADWMLAYGGELFVLNTKTPQATKDTTSRCSFVDLTFTSYAENELKRYFFVEMSSTENGTAVANRYNASLRLNCTDFVAAFNKVLKYYFGDMFKMVVDASAEITTEVKDLSIEYTYLWDALSIFSDEDIFDTTWTIDTDADGNFTITIGKARTTIGSHVFQYGYQGGLQKIERQIEDADIYNQLLGRGGTQNLPYRYFKKQDPNNTAFAGDPDACAELENIYFDRILDLNFRYYIKGWLRNPNRQVSTDVDTSTADGDTVKKSSISDVTATVPLKDLFPSKTELIQTKTAQLNVAMPVTAGYVGQLSGTPVVKAANGGKIPDIVFTDFRLTGTRLSDSGVFPGSALPGDAVYNLTATMTLTLSDSDDIDSASDYDDITYGYTDVTLTEVKQTIATTDYPVPTDEESEEVVNSWAYQKGLSDTKFSPVEYVKDDDSIAAYGIRQGRREDDDDIYPTIQGITVDPYGRIDEVVAVGDIKDGSGLPESKTGDMPTAFVNHFSLKSAGFTSTQLTATFTFDTAGGSGEKREFSVDEGYLGRISYELYATDQQALYGTVLVTYSLKSFYAVSKTTGEKYSIPAGYVIPGGDTYYLEATFELTLNDASYLTPSQNYKEVDLGFQKLKVEMQALPATLSEMDFEVWIKNVWQTEQGEDETDEEYADRVWEPILGDRAGDSAVFNFADGFMSASSDYEFIIESYPTVDRTKTLDGVASEWKLILRKSDAEYEAIGKYIPYEDGPKPVAGDHFFFTGIDMPHAYVVWAEKRLNAAKEADLAEKAWSNPTWAIEVDPVRINTLEGDETTPLADLLKVGNVMQIFDKRFTGGEILSLAIRSMTVTWSEGANTLPSYDIVLSEDVLAYEESSALTASKVQANLDSSVTKLRQQLAAQQKTYLSKSHDDIAVGRIRFHAGIQTGPVFISGEAGVGSRIDEQGIGEFDAIKIRHFLEVPELRYNRISVNVGNVWRAPGGGVIESVEPDTDDDGNELTTGTIHLHLQSGESGKVALDDICMGIYHDGITESENAVEDLDDGIGNFKFKGFYTCYFRITDILDGDSSVFRYALRPVSDNWTLQKHPCEAMHFVAYGNFSDTGRQTSRYSALTYERFLRGVNSWEFGESNVGAQFGDLSNLSIFGLEMSGYSAFLNNIYMSGTVQQLQLAPLRLDVDRQGMSDIGPDDKMPVTCTLYKGWDDWTDKVTSWKIERDTGDAASDAAWALLDKVKAFDGTITLDYTDLGESISLTLFTLTATIDDDTSATAEITI